MVIVWAGTFALMI
ncbi:membrane protein YpdK [Klebsiella quasipneumoniae subsp. similipneumoniae]|uniref:Uncharacterized membrane protein YpdK n=2 Tax=Enterobacteriaceae TaxID=543 RepID=A0A212I3F5_9ENTR